MWLRTRLASVSVKHVSSMTDQIGEIEMNSEVIAEWAGEVTERVRVGARRKTKKVLFNLKFNRESLVRSGSIYG
jgi:hypothetical protein